MANRARLRWGGKAWEVVHVEWERGLCIVRPTTSGKAPRWSGSSGFLGHELCQAMLRVLLGEDRDPAWSKRFTEVIATLRAEHAFLSKDRTSLVRQGDTFEWWTFGGDAANVLLARLLEAELGEKVTSDNIKLRFKDAAGESEVAIRQAVDKLAEQERPTDAEALSYAAGPTKGRFSKFDRCLPEAQLLELQRERLIDAKGARAVTRAGI